MASNLDAKQHMIDPVMSASSLSMPIISAPLLSPVSVGVMEEQTHKSPSPSAYAMPPQHPGLSPPNGHQHEHHEHTDGEDENDEFYPSRRNHSYKRAEDPPRNPQGKMVCKFDHKDCRGLIFDRKCEWSKHMDKHDRPYKCHARGCEKLRGFTYSGGLLRHEREVHKMHGGTKKSLYCPHADCKRSSGAGFTRKENLAEHIRRVHRISSGTTEPNGLPDVNGLTDRVVTSPEADNQWLNDQTSHAIPMPMDDLDPALAELDSEARKRKRTINDVTNGDDIDGMNDGELRAMVKRLKKESEIKDARLKALEDTVANMKANGVM